MLDFKTFVDTLVFSVQAKSNMGKEKRKKLKKDLDTLQGQILNHEKLKALNSVIHDISSIYEGDAVANQNTYLLKISRTCEKLISILGSVHLNEGNTEKFSNLYIESDLSKRLKSMKQSISALGKDTAIDMKDILDDINVLQNIRQDYMVEKSNINTCTANIQAYEIEADKKIREVINELRSNSDNFKSCQTLADIENKFKELEKREDNYFMSADEIKTAIEKAEGEIKKIEEEQKKKTNEEKQKLEKCGNVFNQVKKSWNSLSDNLPKLRSTIVLAMDEIEKDNSEEEKEEDKKKKQCKKLALELSRRKAHLRSKNIPTQFNACKDILKLVGKDTIFEQTNIIRKSFKSTLKQLQTKFNNNRARTKKIEKEIKKLEKNREKNKEKLKKLLDEYIPKMESILKDTDNEGPKLLQEAKELKEKLKQLTNKS